MGKRHYRENSFGLAEQHFRRAVEKGPKDVEAWVGLAASYDKLKRFDLADRAYAQAIRLVGPTAEILNNQGYSYLLRGDRRRARVILLQAQAKDPGNPYIQKACARALQFANPSHNDQSVITTGLSLRNGRALQGSRVQPHSHRAF